MALNELQQAAKELGLYNKNTAKKQKKKREERHNYWVNKTNENNSNLNILDPLGLSDNSKSVSSFAETLIPESVKQANSKSTNNLNNAIFPDVVKSANTTKRKVVSYGNDVNKDDLKNYIWSQTGIMPIDPQNRRKSTNNSKSQTEEKSKMNKVDALLTGGAKISNDLGINISQDKKAENDKIISDYEAKKLQKKIENKTITQDEVNELYDYVMWYSMSNEELKNIVNSPTDSLTDPMTGNPYKEEKRQKAWSLYGSRLLSEVSDETKYKIEKDLENDKRDEITIKNRLKKDGFDNDESDLMYNYITGNYTKGTRLSELIEDHPIAMSLASVMLNEVSGLPAAVETATELIDKATDSKGYEQKVKNGDYELKRAKNFQYTNAANEIRSGVSKKISESFENENLGKAASLVYGTGMSILDNITNRALGGDNKALSLGLMSSTAFSNQIVDTINNGGTITEAAVKGIASAVIEAATENISWNSMQNFLGSGKNGFISFMLSATKEALPEGMEEGISYVAGETFNALYDSLSAASNGDFTTRFIPQYDLNELLENVVSGILSGYGMSTGAAYAQSVNTKITGNIYLERGKENIIIKTAKNNGIKTAYAQKTLNALNEFCENEYTDTEEGNDKYFKLQNKAGRAIGALNNTLQEKLDVIALQEYNNQLNDTNEGSAEEKYSAIENNNTKDFVKQFLKGNNQSAVETVNNDGVEINDGIDGNGAFVENTESNIGNEIIDDNTESNIDVTGETDNRKTVADTLKINNRLASINETAKSETAVNDLTEHIDDTYYKIVYNETVNIEDNSKDTSASAQVGATPSVSGADSSLTEGAFSVEERSAEFNRIYDMGMDEDIPPHKIESDIFTPEQVRRIYAAAVIDDNKRNNYSEQVNFTELLKEYEDKAAIAQFGNETVKNIMTASAEQVKSAAHKLGLNVEFTYKVPGRNPNADGAYNPKTNTIYINNNTKYPMQQVFLHELTHFFESADNYSEFQNTVFKSRAFKKWLGKYTNLKNDKYKSIDEYRNALKERYREKDDTKINREIVAFFVSDNLFQKDFGDLGRLATELKGSKKERFISFIKNIFKRFKNAVSGIDKLEKKFLSLYRTAGQNKNTDNNNGVKNMYTGEKSQTVDKLNLETAKEMEKQGVDSETIRKETGWFRGYDKKWRFEIDDSMIKIDKTGKFSKNPDVRRYLELFNKAYIECTATADEMNELAQLDKKFDGKSIVPNTLGDLLQHNELFEAYPQLKDIGITFYDFKDGTNGWYDRMLNQIVLGKTLGGEALKRTLFHEIQHAVQQIEDFTGGATPEYWGNKILNNALKEKSRIKDKLLKQSDEMTKEVVYMYDEYLERQSYKGNISSSEFAKTYDTAAREISDEDIGDLFWDYANATEEYYKIKEDISAKSMIAYRKTAGEIEARDVANRRNFTAEQRKNTRPDIDRTDVIFSDSGVSYLISKDNKGNDVVVMVENILKGVKNGTHQVIANEIAKNIGKYYKIIESGQKVYIGKDLPGEYTQSVYTRRLNKQIKRVKNQSAQNLGEMIEIATERKWEKNRKLKHSKDAKYGWYNYTTRLAIPKMDSQGNVINFNVYTAKLVIRNDENGKKYLYDIQDIKKENSSRLPAPLIAKVRNIRSNSLNNNISQKDNVVNSSISEKSKNDTDIRYMLDEDNADGNETHKQKQLDIVLKNNAVNDDYHTWIRTKDDILTFEEALQDSDNDGWEDDGFTPDYDGEMAKQALKTGKITVYSSYPIKQGVFVTPSRMEAESYAGNGKIYESTVNLTDVAWIDAMQGQYARVDNSFKFSVDDEVDRYTEKQYNNFGWVRANNVLTSAEYQHFNNSFSDNKNLDFKFTKNPTTKETIIPTGDNANLLNVLVYTKGTFNNPIITKVVRIEGSSESVSILRNEVFDYEREGYREPIKIIESDYGQKIFNTLKRENFSNLSELKRQRKGNNSNETNSDSETGENRTRSAETNSADSKAGLNKSAFSIGEDTDIRYMLSEEDKFDSFGNYFDEDENGEVTFISAEQYIDELKKNPKIGVLDKQQIELKAKSLLKTYQSRMDSADVASQLLAIYNDIKNIDENGNHAKPKIEKLANDIYDNIVEKVSNGELYEQLTEFFKLNPIVYDESLKDDFSSDFSDFIRKNRRRLNLIKAESGKKGLSIDEAYDNLLREFPGLFSDRHDGPKEQLEEMARVLDSQKYMYNTFLDDNKEDIINQIIGDIYGGFAQIDYIKKGSDKAKAQTDYKFDNQYLDEYGVYDKRFKADMRKQINEKSADFVKEQKRRYKNGEISASQFADSLTEHFARVSLTAKIKPLESYYRASYKYRLRFKQINERTTKNLKELRSMLQNPTEGKYIPADLVDLVQNVLNIGDNQNFNLRDKLKRYRDTLSRADIDESVLDVYKQAIDKCEDELSKQNLGQVFAEISRKYNSYKTGKAENTQAGEFEQSFYCYHEAVAQKLEQVAAVLENADMTRLTMRQAEALDEGLNCLTHFVKNSVKAIGLTESAHIAEVGHDMIQETKATAVHKNFASKMLNTAINTELSPERMFRRMGGYAPDSMWVKMADMLTEGQTQAEVIKQRLKDVIAPALNGENMKNAENARSYKNKDLVDIGLVDENGESVKVPHSFMISAYLHLQNEANQNHALKGGFEIPDFRTYYKGKISKSFTEGKSKARFTDVTSALKKLEQNMSEYDKLVAKNVALLFDTHTKSEYNKINTDVFGFEKAKVKHYFPIYSSNDFIATGFDISYEASLKNQGNMKSRVAGAVNPIKLMDVFDVVDKEISRCGEYCGKLKAEITMTRVYNTTTAEFGTSLKEQIGLHFGESGKKYIEHLMQDYSGTRKTENSVALSKLRGAVATSALMGNINVAMKQAGSYPTAAATIGWKPLLKALAVSDEGAKVFYRANRQLIDKYTPWLRYRTEGYSTQEIADLKNLSFYNKRQMKWLFGWINASDIATVGRLWQAAQYYVDDNNVELKKGTDEYYKQVAKVFNKIIFDTQPNYTVMQRPDILRNPNSLLKSMIMFSTQPLQNLGILYDSAMNYNAQLKAFKQGKVEKSVLQEAKRGLARGISSIVVSAGVISLMTLLAKAIRGKLDDYLDKYGEFNAVGILKGSLKVFGSTMAGMVTFGSEIYNFIMSAVTGDTYYGVNISSIDLISDVFESFINEITAVKNQKDILNKTVAFVEKSSALFGFPARNLKNLFGGVTNLISTGDWFALNEKKTDSQYYAQMYDCCINGENEKYNKLYNELLERGKTVNEIEGGIKTCLKEAESDDIKEAAQALIDGDNKIYNDIINEFISRGFDEKIALETVDEVADKLKGDELTDEQKKTKEKSKYTYMQNLLNKIDFSGLSSKQKAEAQQEVEKMADEYGYQAATGEPKNATYDNALKSDKAGVVPAKDFVIAKTLLQKKYADADGDGNVSAQEKYDAIQKSNIPSDIKKLLQAMNIMGSKKIDTDNDGKTETAFDDLSAKEQKEYINKNNSDILKILEDTNASAEKSEIKANYRAKLESKINVFDYKEKYRSDVQNEIDYLSSAAADIDINGDTDSSTAKAVLSFDESGFIDIADYVKFYVNAKKYTKNEEKLEVINQLDISDNAKLRLKLWTVASGWSLDSDGDGKRDKRISTYSPEFQEKWIKENAGYIQSNCSYWR